MALTDIEKVRLIVGDISKSPFYPIFTDEEIESFIEMSGSIRQAAIMAACSAAMYVAGLPTRERVGDLEAANMLSTQYIKALEYIIKDTSYNLPKGLIPWCGGISKSEMAENDNTPDNFRHPIFYLNTIPT